MSKNLSKSDIHKRIGELLFISNPEHFMEFEVNVLKNQNPNLSEEKAEEYFILRLVKQHNDTKLDHLWYSFKNNAHNKKPEAA